MSNYEKWMSEAEERREWQQANRPDNRDCFDRFINHPVTIVTIFLLVCWLLTYAGSGVS
jgi:hypothetical protein